MPNLMLKMPPRLAEKLRAAMRNEEDERGGTVRVEACDPAELAGGRRGEGGKARPEQKLTLEIAGDRYPAALVNLPCNVEAMKTFDGRTYFKSSDIGQAIMVYETEEDRANDLAICETFEVSVADQQQQEAEEEKKKAGDGDGDGEKPAPPKRKVKEKRYYHSGLTPPTVDIVRRRFLNTKYWEADRQRYERDEVRNACHELEQYLPPVRKGRGREAREPVHSELVYENLLSLEDLVKTVTAVSKKTADGTDPDLGVDGDPDVWDVPLEQLLENYPAFARHLLRPKDLKELQEKVEAEEKEKPEMTQFRPGSISPTPGGVPAAGAVAAAADAIMDIEAKAKEADARVDAKEPTTPPAAAAAAAGASTPPPPAEGDNEEDILFTGGGDLDFGGEFGSFTFDDDVLLGTD